MTLWSALARIMLLFMAVALTACVSPGSRQKTASGRYGMPEDSPVLEPIDLSAVKPVIPVSVERTGTGNKSPYRVNGKTYRVMPSEAGYVEEGTASWYGRKFQGHLTSDGEVYDMFQLSAAHRSLPLPSFINVTNLENGKSVIVRVNDRGPFHDGRIVDLSYAAAAVLGFAKKGTTRVRIEAVEPGASAPRESQRPVLLTGDTQGDIQKEVQRERELIDRNAGREFLQVGAFSSLDSARRMLDRVREYTALPVFIRSDRDVNSGNMLHRVRLGPVNETIDIQRLIDRIAAAGLGTPFRVRQ